MAGRGARFSAVTTRAQRDITADEAIRGEGSEHHGRRRRPGARGLFPGSSWARRLLAILLLPRRRAALRAVRAGHLIGPVQPGGFVVLLLALRFVLALVFRLGLLVLVGVGLLGVLQLGRIRGLGGVRLGRSRRRRGLGPGGRRDQRARREQQREHSDQETLHGFLLSFCAGTPRAATIYVDVTIYIDVYFDVTARIGIRAQSRDRAHSPQVFPGSGLR